MKKIYTKAAASILAAAVLSATGISALAAEESCGWQSGKAQYESRHKIFTEAAQQADDSAREGLSLPLTVSAETALTAARPGWTWKSWSRPV